MISTQTVGSRAERAARRLPLKLAECGVIERLDAVFVVRRASLRVMVKTMPTMVDVHEP